MALRDVERHSTRAFLEDSVAMFDGRKVLDYGCGSQPYRSLIEGAGGAYTAFDSTGFPAHVAGPLDTLSAVPTFDADAMAHIRYDVVVCTQVIQYVDPPEILLRKIAEHVADGGTLLLTGPTNWPIVETSDLWRFTVAGITSLLKKAGWRTSYAATRGLVRFEGEDWPLGFEAIATRR